MVVENKRKADESALVPVGKKAKNDVALSNKNKQLTQLNPVRTNQVIYIFSEQHPNFVFAGSSSNIQPVCSYYGL